MLTVFCCVHPSHTDSRLHSFFAARVCGYLKCLHVLKVIVTFFFFFIIVTPVWWLAVEVFSMSQADEQLYSCRVCLELKLSPVTAPDFVILLHCFFCFFSFVSIRRTSKLCVFDSVSLVSVASNVSFFLIFCSWCCFQWHNSEPVDKNKQHYYLFITIYMYWNATVAPGWWIGQNGVA